MMLWRHCSIDKYLICKPTQPPSTSQDYLSQVDFHSVRVGWLNQLGSPLFRPDFPLFKLLPYTCPPNAPVFVSLSLQIFLKMLPSNLASSLRNLIPLVKNNVVVRPMASFCHCRRSRLTTSGTDNTAFKTQSQTCGRPASSVNWRQVVKLSCSHV